MFVAVAISIAIEKQDAKETEREKDQRMKNEKKNVRYLLLAARCSLFTIIQCKQMLMSMTLIALPFMVHIG